MSAITVSRPEVVNGHTDVICSTSVSHILAVRKTALLQIDTLIRQLAEISSMTESIGGKTSLDWAMKQDFRCGCWLMEKPETAMKAITRNLDREIWRDLMQRSGMLSLMDARPVIHGTAHWSTITFRKSVKRTFGAHLSNCTRIRMKCLSEE